MPRTIEYAGKRFIIAPPIAPGCNWVWRQHGEGEPHEASSEQNAYLAIGAWSALQRIRGKAGVMG